ncbi:hypothetical protein [Sideroxydans sp. CL21]|uniref:hypothetical protein n=1 Tax=Sideroxydans sp. CL21 TaxID=2600596 RepID=UPI0024BC745C|nr:hypothetical protein [Sideroxydans sp. CL21]
MIKPNRIYSAAIVIAAGLIASPAFAEDESFFSNWLANVSSTQEEQPHWMTPLVTVTPRLEQEYRFDYSHSDVPKPKAGTTIDSYGGGKGIEIIPSRNTEIIVGVPAYQVKDVPNKPSVTGVADENLLLKYRILTANEEHGNYIVTAFLGTSLQTGGNAFTTNHTLVTPTIAAGKGWGDRQSGVDIQSTLGMAVPSGGVSTLGRPLTWNMALQGHVGKFWPEIETNYIHWYDGALAGKSQMMITYGTTIGRFVIKDRVKAIVGIGYQIVQGTQVVNLNHATLATMRITF